MGHRLRRSSVHALWPMPSHSVVATIIYSSAKLFEDPDQRQLFTRGLDRVACQQRAKFCRPPAELRSRLDHTLILEGRLSRPQHFADRIPRYLQVTRDLLDRLALDK